jgi:hypothetical protein
MLTALNWIVSQYYDEIFVEKVSRGKTVRSGILKGTCITCEFHICFMEGYVLGRTPSCILSDFG